MHKSRAESPQRLSVQRRRSSDWHDCGSDDRSEVVSRDKDQFTREFRAAKVLSRLRNALRHQGDVSCVRVPPEAHIGSR
ncbi:unnamed protein product [Protopolystoma xenopodis]|uniref:Uncharacterized protein n=1 Tax=Protopolystoma xenopodis TaxID=117903 RepID=A0A3S5AW14_9PLAT|nr:unnamed protein product [Protopolystoma xenopodis]